MCVDKYTVTKKTEPPIGNSAHTQNTHEPISSSPAQGFVPEVGLEPTHLSIPVPKTGVATVTPPGQITLKNVTGYYRSEGQKVSP